MGGSSDGSSTVQQYDPKLTPYIMDILDKAKGQLPLVPTTPFEGPYVAGPTEAQTTGNQIAADVAMGAQGMGNTAVDLASLLGEKFASGGYAPLKFEDYTSTPALESTITAASKPIFDQYFEQIIPQMQSQATELGAYGGGVERNILPEIVSREMSTALADTAAKYAFSDMLSLRDANQASAGMELDVARIIPNLIQTGYLQNLIPAETLQQVGATEQGWNQGTINDLLARYNAAVTAPFQGLNQYANLIYGAPGGSTSTTTTDAGSNPLGGAVGGGLLGLTAFGPLGALGGAVLGGLLGGF